MAMEMVMVTVVLCVRIRKKIPGTHLTPKAPPPKFDNKFDDTTNETSMVRCQ
jgi:hypothetical protein